MNRLFTLFLLVLVCGIAHAQSAVSGKLYEKTSDSAISGINIFNTKTRASVRSDKEGRYSITANENDTIIFSGTGFISDTLAVTYEKLLIPQDITLSVQYVALKAVKVTNSYSADSIARLKDYAYLFNTHNSIMGKHPEDRVGVSISPLGYFSSKAKQQRTLKSNLIKNEEQAFIDFSFSPDLVEHLTNLHGDSLRIFLYRYRPSYEFCRQNERQNMIVYINDRLKEFRKPGQ